MYMLQTSAIITKMACWGQGGMDEKNLHFYVTWLRDQLRLPVSGLFRNRLNLIKYIA